MYITTHEPERNHLHITLEEGPHPGTWEVSLDAGGRWRVRSPEGNERILESTGPWIGDLASDLDGLMRRIAPRAVVEVMHREKVAREEAEEARGVHAVA